MNRYKENDSKNPSFERKIVNGKTNPKYVDLLEEDKPIAGQKFACISFVSPENILKQKHLFFFFLKTVCFFCRSTFFRTFHFI